MPTHPQSPGNPCLALLHPQPSTSQRQGREPRHCVSGKFTPMALLSQRLPGSLKGEGQSQSHLCSPDLSLHFPPILPVALWVGILIRQSGGALRKPLPSCKIHSSIGDFPLSTPSHLDEPQKQSDARLEPCKQGRDGKGQLSPPIHAPRS